MQALSIKVVYNCVLKELYRRYRDVEPVINTGTNLRTELERLEELHQLYRFRSDEVFRRLTIDNLVSLVVEVRERETGRGAKD